MKRLHNKTRCTVLYRLGRVTNSALVLCANFSLAFVGELVDRGRFCRFDVVPRADLHAMRKTTMGPEVFFGAKFQIAMLAFFVRLFLCQVQIVDVTNETIP